MGDAEALKVIREAVAYAFGISVFAMLKKTHQRTVADARHLGMYLSRRLTKASQAEVATIYRKKDHRIVKYGTDRVSDRMSIDKKFRAEVENLEDMLKMSLGRSQNKAQLHNQIAA